ncbi:hypothetical protein GCM10008090_08350 [Arenicella chitinivorans]|uniref:DUF2520 domain-containing protein n=1 Tax=Arenicella chitinivorans TaxID=1329800 RepID=A0A918VJN6_9GAMM|nr:DUF2520 domain-containing protein [Arenicella chitinivorans]GHA01532.1 hypothetical protein GCM10008090_08350 [Arenicella chitinivorans]
MESLAGKNIAVVGAEDFGLAIAQSFQKQKATVFLTGPNTTLIAEKAKKLNIRTDVQPMLNAVVSADLVLLAVPEAEIESTCKILAINLKKGAVIAHFSKVLDSTALESAHKKSGVHVCSLYPVNKFYDLEASQRILNNRLHRSYLYGEGDRAALKITDAMFKLIGFVPMTISRESKPKYHAASVIASDYLTVLLEASMRIASSTGVDGKLYWRSIQPLVKGTLESILQRGFDSTLGGPIMGGDTNTVANHLTALEHVSSNLPTLYANLGKHVLAHATQHNRLDKSTILKLHTVLNDVDIKK